MRNERTWRNWSRKSAFDFFFLFVFWRVRCAEQTNNNNFRLYFILRIVLGGLDAMQIASAVHIFAHPKIAAAAVGHGCIGHRIAAAICARNTLRDRYVCHTNQFQFYDSPLRTKVRDGRQVQFYSQSLHYKLTISFDFLRFANRVTELLDYTPEELTGRNLYNLCHAEDADKLRKNHLDCKYSDGSNGSMCEWS